ncbi:hypothetical protein CPC08DRAFT_704967 [Agrocybe pediades]|nr:hypothetical protein CPC08DRAFT_704967 [Agrocybe pediades]
MPICRMATVSSIPVSVCTVRSGSDIVSHCSPPRESRRHPSASEGNNCATPHSTLDPYLPRKYFVMDHFIMLGQDSFYQYPIPQFPFFTSRISRHQIAFPNTVFTHCRAVSHLYSYTLDPFKFRQHSLFTSCLVVASFASCLTSAFASTDLNVVAAGHGLRQCIWVFAN